MAHMVLKGLKITFYVKANLTWSKPFQFIASKNLIKLIYLVFLEILNKLEKCILYLYEDLYI